MPLKTEYLVHFPPKAKKFLDLQFAEEEANMSPADIEKYREVEKKLGIGHDDYSIRVLRDIHTMTELDSISSLIDDDDLFLVLWHYGVTTNAQLFYVLDNEILQPHHLWKYFTRHNDAQKAYELLVNLRKARRDIASRWN